MSGRNSDVFSQKILCSNRKKTTACKIRTRSEFDWCPDSALCVIFIIFVADLFPLSRNLRCYTAFAVGSSARIRAVSLETIDISLRFLFKATAFTAKETQMAHVCSLDSLRDLRRGEAADEGSRTELSMTKGTVIVQS